MLLFLDELMRYDGFGFCISISKCNGSTWLLVAEQLQLIKVEWLAWSWLEIAFLPHRMPCFFPVLGNNLVINEMLSCVQWWQKHPSWSQALTKSLLPEDCSTLSSRAMSSHDTNQRHDEILCQRGWEWSSSWSIWTGRGLRVLKCPAWMTNWTRKKNRCSILYLYMVKYASGMKSIQS